MRRVLLLLALVAVAGSCRRRATDGSDLMGPGSGMVHLYVEEQVVGDSVDVALFFSSSPWGEGVAKSVDSVAVDGAALDPLSTGLYSFRMPLRPSFTLFVQASSLETTLTIPVDTLTPPRFLAPSTDTTVTPGDSFLIRLSRQAHLVILRDTTTLFETNGVDSLWFAFSSPGSFALDASLWDTLLQGTLGDGTVGVRTGGQTRRLVQAGTGSGGYTLTADTTSTGCSGGAPCFSWSPADSLEALSVYRKTGAGEELWWDIQGNPDPQDTTRVIPFGPPVTYGQADPSRYRVISGPVDTLRSGETFRIYGFLQGVFVLLGEYTRP